MSLTLWTSGGPKPSSPWHTFKRIITGSHLPEPSQSSTRERGTDSRDSNEDIHTHIGHSPGTIHKPHIPSLPATWLQLPFLTLAPPLTEVGGTRKKGKLNPPLFSFVWHRTKMRDDLRRGTHFLHPVPHIAPSHSSSPLPIPAAPNTHTQQGPSCLSSEI